MPGSKQMSNAIRTVVGGDSLSVEQARDASIAIMNGGATDAQIGALLVALRMKGETPAELAGLAMGVRGSAVPLETSREDVVDISGTGGDGANSFNISTAAAIIASGAGVAVAKQVTGPIRSICGSADCLRELGVRLDVSPAVVAQCLDEVGLAFLDGTVFHPKMRHNIGPRQELATPTAFNILAPLCNPAPVSRLVVGVADPRMTEAIASALDLLDLEAALVVHGMAGMDELSTCGDNQVTELRSHSLSSALWNPEQYGFALATMEDLAGGTPEQSAAIAASILSGEPGPRRDVAVFNAAAVIYISGRAPDMYEAMSMANESIDSGAAQAKLVTVRELTRRG